MSTPGKLKPNYALWISCIIAIIISVVIVIILEKDILDDRTFRYIIAVAMTWGALNQIIFLIRTRNKRFLFPLLMFADVAITNYAYWFGMNTLQTISGIALIPLIIIVLVMETQRKFTFKVRDVLELAAKPIKGTGDGFTPRPYPAGKHKVDKDIIIGFARYINKHLIALSFIDEDRIILEITANRWKHLFSLKTDFQKITCVSFDYSGSISVHISERDYKKYKDELTFDELCASLGQVFIRFLDYYKTGAGDKILNEILQTREDDQ